MSEEQKDSDHLADKTHMNNNNFIPPHWHEETTIANEIRQHFYRTGGEKPPLILLHGFSENALCWSRVAKALENDFDSILVDARGHGLSSGPETGYSQALLAQDLASLIEELGIQRPILFGHSNGAFTAAQIAAIYPQLVQSIVLEDPPWGESSWQPPVTTERNEPWPGFNAWYNAWIAWHKALRTQTPQERVASSRQFLPPGALDWPEEELFPFLEAQAQFNEPRQESSAFRHGGGMARCPQAENIHASWLFDKVREHVLYLCYETGHYRQAETAYGCCPVHGIATHTTGVPRCAEPCEQVCV